MRMLARVSWVLALAPLAGCYVHGSARLHHAGPPRPPAHRPPPPAYQPPPPQPGPVVVETTTPAPQPLSPPPRDPIAPSRARVRAPAAPYAPTELAVTVEPSVARRGYEVVVRVYPFYPQVAVSFNGRPVPIKPSPAGDSWIVTIPTDANSGFFEVAWNGRRFRSNFVNVTP